MKVLFDEDVPRKRARSLPGHEIHTVVSMQWGGIKNGALLTLIARESFDVFLTGDKNMHKQQRLRPHIQKISVALDDCGVFIPRLKRPGE